MIPKQTKKELRLEFQNKRNQLNKFEINALSEKIFNHLENAFDFKNKTLSIFLTIEKKNEIKTLEFINKYISSSIITSPISDFKNSTLKHIRLFNLEEQLKENKYGIPEPQFGDFVDVKKIDIVLVPLLIFDLEGYRVGYGKGFYDRFLSNCSQNCKFIGLSLFEPISKIEDPDQYDIPLHMVITPNKAYHFH